MLVKDLINELNKYYEPDDHVAYDLWSTVDVIEQAASNGIKLTQEAAEAIIENVDRCKDNNYGITWDTLDYFIDEYKGPGKEEGEDDENDN